MMDPAVVCTSLSCPVWVTKGQRRGFADRLLWVDLGPSAPPSRLDRGDVNFLHIHHRNKRAFCFIAAGSHRLGQHARRDLPRDAPFVLAPTARTFLAAIADDGIPVAVG